MGTGGISWFDVPDAPGAWPVGDLLPTLDDGYPQPTPYTTSLLQSFTPDSGFDPAAVHELRHPDVPALYLAGLQDHDYLQGLPVLANAFGELAVCAVCAFTAPTHISVPPCCYSLRFPSTWCGKILSKAGVLHLTLLRATF